MCPRQEVFWFASAGQAHERPTCHIQRPYHSVHSKCALVFPRIRRRELLAGIRQGSYGRMEVVRECSRPGGALARRPSTKVALSDGHTCSDNGTGSSSSTRQRKHRREGRRTKNSATRGGWQLTLGVYGWHICGDVTVKVMEYERTE